ncbi:DUF5107 domain-containing protein [Arcticibacter sp.]|uniref:DUF5107 domain-containing protein n=1 Tax=Arcticibacter sp. TaxID=1872630 RepID=UPI00388ECB95
MNLPIVKAWTQTVTIPTYEVGTPDKNPMFFEKRVYQGSSGAVYPNPIIEKIYDDKINRDYQAVYLENQYIKIMILPELGGRVQMAWDKIKERHFIYYNQVIKPALVGLCGPWISGGIEFNWPQHHRPSTFEPVDFSIEENPDGSKTVWVNELEKMFRTKGMAGFTLHPDKAYLEIKAKLYNRTDLPQTFLWWANPAVAVNDHYQSVFPPDVNAVFDHGKRDVSTFPIATGTYYKVDYAPGTDISRYKNIPVPTSYMAVNSRYNFVGGYEHDTRSGVLHVADHHVSPGKKQWTWGCGDFGKAWDRNLTDEDGPYIELMTGVFTDNQPDFSWLMPYEEKSFTQYFLPYRELGIIRNASQDLLLGLDLDQRQLTIRIFATSAMTIQAIVLVRGAAFIRQDITLSPEQPYGNTFELPVDADEQDLLIRLLDSNEQELLKYDPAADEESPVPEAAKAAKTPQETESCEQLFLTGQHLEQYRHATFSPVPYYMEALRRDAGDIRNNNALGAWYLRRGQFKQSEGYFHKAIETITQRNPNPYDGEAYYNLGLCLKYQGRMDEAYEAFYKASWNSAWQDAAFFSLAQIALLRKEYHSALGHINGAMDRNARNGKAYVLKALALKSTGRLNDALAVAETGLKRDPFNIGLLFQKAGCLSVLGHDDQAAEVLKVLQLRSRGSANTLIEYAADLGWCGAYAEAVQLLSHVRPEEQHSPMLLYYLGYYHELSGSHDLAQQFFEKGALADPAYCFPNKLEDIQVLQMALRLNSRDAKAAYYLGNLWYDKRQYQEAIRAWEHSAASEPCFPTVWRNLGIAQFNHLHNHKNALQCLERAHKLNKNDHRVLMELDQLYKRLNHLPAKRLAFLNENLGVAMQRDDLFLEIAALYNFHGQYDKAHALISSRKFHPWEGGEGKVSGQYLYSLTEMAKEHMWNGNAESAITCLMAAQAYPENLGEGKLFGARENDIHYWLGRACESLGQTIEAADWYQQAAAGLSEPSAAIFYNDQQPDKIFYQGLARYKLGDKRGAEQIFSNLIRYGKQHKEDEVRIDYFAVSLPDLLVFEDNLAVRNRIHCLYLQGLGHLGLGEKKEALGSFNTILQMDAMHFGARTHQEMLEKDEAALAGKFLQD